MSEQFYLVIDAKVKGPFSQAQIRNGIKSGTITPQTLAALRGSENWVAVAELLDRLHHGEATPTATEHLLAALRDRLAGQTAMQRLGLSGDPSPVVVEKTFLRLSQQVQERAAAKPTTKTRQLCDEIEALLQQAIGSLRDPKERFILRRAADLGVDSSKEENRTYLGTLYHRDMGQEAFDAGRMGDALKHFDALLAAEPENMQAIWQRAVALYRVDPLRTQEALSELRRCTEQWPDAGEPYRWLAELSLELGRRDEARQLASRALEINASDSAARQVLETVSGRAQRGSTPPSKISRGAGNKSAKGKKSKAASQDKVKYSAAKSSTEPERDGLGFIKVMVICAILFGFLGTQALQMPDRCFPQGDQEYFMQPGTYYDFRDPGGERLPGTTCPPSLHPPQGAGYFVQLEAELGCREEVQAEAPNISDDQLDAECARIPIARPDSPRASESNFFYTRRFTLLLVGLLCIAFLGRGASIGERFREVGFGGDPAIAVGVGLGLVIGFLSPLQFTLAPVGTLLALTLFHVVCEEVFFRGFVTAKLVDSFESPLAPVVLSGIIFGIYHITYTSFWWITPMAIPAWIGLVTIGAGIPYAFLYIRGGTLLAPLACHLVVNGLMMWRSHNAVTTLLG
jgi:membrane protease YdiL (CAAX protease family)/tetratricopeptide (TPR) repeat protein